MSEKKKATDIVHIHDEVFHRMIQLSPQVRIEMINEIFKTDFPLDTPNVLLDTNHVNSFLEHRTGDCLISVTSGDKTENYHVECMAYSVVAYGAVMFRYGYGLSDDGDIGTELRFVHQAVLVTRYAPRLKERINFSILTDDLDHPGAMVEHKFSFLLYNLLNEGYEKTKHVTVFLPFQLGDVKELFRKAKGWTSDLDRLLKERLQDMGQVVDSKVKSGILTVETAVTLKDLIATYTGNQFTRYYKDVSKEEMVEMVRTTMRLRLQSDELISNLHRAKEQVASLKGQNADKDREVASLKQQVGEQAQQLVNQAREIADLKRQLEAITQQMQGGMTPPGNGS